MKIYDRFESEKNNLFNDGGDSCKDFDKKIVDGRKIKNTIEVRYKNYSDDIRFYKKKALIVQYYDDESIEKKLRSDAATVSREQKEKIFKTLGYDVESVVFNKNFPENSILDVVEDGNRKDSVSFVICQLPFPEWLSDVPNCISKNKDIDCINRKTSKWSECATADGAFRIAENSLKLGLTPVVFGGLGFVGSGLVNKLNCNGYNPVIVDKDDSVNLSTNCDVVFSTVGSPEWLGRQQLLNRHKSLAIDTGFTPTNMGVRGDIDRSCYDLFDYYTPVPGGMGPTEMAVLAERAMQKDVSSQVETWHINSRFSVSWSDEVE